MRDLQLPGRSVVHCVNGAAATSHPLSSLAAIEVLRQGGNAVDAAVTACAVQCVVEPMSTGIGGDCFALLWPAEAGRVIGVNGSGRAPQALSAAWLLEQGISSIDLQSPHSVTVPGAVAAWAKLLQDHGSIDLASALAPAINYAAEGFALTPRVAFDWRRHETKLKADANAARIYLPRGRAPAAGEVHRLPQLAETLRAIARDGADGFYRGRVAADIVVYLNSLGGRHALDDFAGQDAFNVEPIAARYRDIDIVEIPPNGVGIVALLMLNILAGFDLGRLDPTGVERVHLEAEASRLSYEAGDRYIADPAFAAVPVAKLLSKTFADELRDRIDPRRAGAKRLAAVGPQYRDTVYLTVVDAERNVCSFINSLYFPFGSGLVSPETGVLLQNRGAGFRVEPGHANCVAPGKRPLHTIMPGMALKGARPWASFGVMGGAFQPVGHVHLLTNLIDYGMDVQEAIDSPRCFYTGGRIEAERGVSDAVLRGLAALGHAVARSEGPWGGAQAILIDWQNGTLAAGSDPRKDGCALGY
jgi:gamma-glutamyltranspeptidase/glutathione hydrolase